MWRRPSVARVSCIDRVLVADASLAVELALDRLGGQAGEALPNSPKSNPAFASG